MNSDTKKPNSILRNERINRGWSQQRLAEQLNTSEDIISKWERGVSKPSRFYQEKLCILFGKNAIELGMIEQKTPEPIAINTVYPASPTSLLQGETSQTAQPLHLGRKFPLPPHPYFAHPYPLQENFTGRIRERQMLTKWLIEGTKPVLSLVALGGMGKSALTWAWLQQDVLSMPGSIFPPSSDEPITLLQVSESKRPEGVLWWSFYEAESSFSSFLNQALTYASNGMVDPKDISSSYEKIQALLTFLQQRRLLFVLDGFERELRAYASMVSTYQSDVVPSDTQDKFRLCIDPHVGSFLRWLAASPLSSRILLTTRLLPGELDGLVGCQNEVLSMLDIEDMLTFLRIQGVHGTRAEMKAICTTYGNHPLALRLLSGLIVHDPERPGEVAVANEYSILPEIVQREHHILELSYNVLHPSVQQLLSTVAAFRSVVDFEKIKVVNPFESERELKRALRELIERGLLFFDRERQRYDLHPIVRQYAYKRLLEKEAIHARLAVFFQSMSAKDFIEDSANAPRKIQILFGAPSPSNHIYTDHLEDIAPIIELYHHLLCAKQFERAFSIYYHHLASLLYHRLGAYQTIIELLQAFLPNYETQLNNNQQSWILDALANAYGASGYPQRAVQLLEASISIDQARDDKESLATAFWNLAVQQQVLGRLEASEESLQESITTCQELHDAFNEAKAHQYMALLRAYQGMPEVSAEHLDTALSLFQRLGAIESEGAVWAYRSLCSLLARDMSTALAAAHHARELADVRSYERDIIRAEWLLGLTLVHAASQEKQQASVMLEEADIHLTEAFIRCRKIDMVDYEGDLLLDKARLYSAKGDKSTANKYAIEALAVVNRSDYRVLRADIYNLLAQLELENGDEKKAMSYAQAAFNDALCDGTPYCYMSALEEAKYLLGKSKLIV
jgi:transcriptional regulator with XRE-family HTH domain/tetratricopeptide (TPR) repeat protein